MSYNYDAVFKSCLEYFNGDELAAQVCINKYLLKHPDGTYMEKDPNDMHRRLAKEFARIEKKYDNPLSEDEIFESLKNFKYIIPQGSPMFGIGNKYQTVSIGNCFVVGQPHDSYAGIIQKDEELAQIMKRRGGVGIDLSTLRPTGSPVNNAARTSDGIRCFMERYSNTTKEVAQGGRRGALMITLDSRHPDLLEFIRVKRDLNKVTGANISVKWHDDFLQAVEQKETYTLRWPVDVPIEEAKMTLEVNASEIWKEFVQSNWASAEPGCLFWDTIINQSISDCYTDEGFGTISTNPCAELTLSEYGACILMVVNLTAFIENPFMPDAKFNYTKYKKYVRIATRLMDDMIDLEIEKCDEIIAKIVKGIDTDLGKVGLFQRELETWQKIKNSYIRGRRVGLGITGLGDTIAMINQIYGSDESIITVDKIFSEFHGVCYDENAELANERGAFPIWNWDKEKDSHYIKILPKRTRDKIMEYGRRNIGINTCAPTGSVSIVCQTSSGIEPIFKKSYNRNRKINDDDKAAGVKVEYKDNDGIEWMTYVVNHHGYELYKTIHPDAEKGTSPYDGAQAEELDPKQRVKLQATIQKYIDHSLSSTINLPKDVDIETISDLYLQGWKEKCKGLTVYRDTARKGVLTSSEPEEVDGIKEAPAPKRPEVLECDIFYSNVGQTPWIFFIGHLNGIPYEIFGGKNETIDLPKKYRKGWIVKNGKAGGRRTYDLYLGSLDDEEERMIVKNIAGEFSADAGSYTRIISTMLRHGIPIKFICEQLKKDDKTASMFSFERVVSRILSKNIKDGETTGENCECGSKFIYESGCVICMSCGNSKCG